jgi:hypothetical protein
MLSADPEERPTVPQVIQMTEALITELSGTPFQPGQPNPLLEAELERRYQGLLLAQSQKN